MQYKGESRKARSVEREGTSGGHIPKVIGKGATGVSRWLLCLGLLVSILTGQSPVATAQTGEPSRADALVAQGITSFQAGEFGEAASVWTEAARLYADAGDTRQQARALTKIAQALQKLGRYTEAAETLQRAIDTARSSQDAFAVAEALGRMGNIQFAVGQLDPAEKNLTQALELARAQEASLLTATLLNDLGNVYVAQRRFSEALSSYTESAVLAQGAGRDLLAVTALINSAKAALEQGLSPNARERLDVAANRLAPLPASHQKAYAWLNIGKAYERIRKPARRLVSTRPGRITTGTRGVEVQPAPGEQPAVEEQPIPEPPPPSEIPPVPMAPIPEPPEAPEIPAPPPAAPPAPPPAVEAPLPPGEKPLILRAAESFEAGIQTARAVGDELAESYGWVYLSELYEDEQRYEEALTLARRATFAAQKVDAPESLYRAQWQTARLLQELGRPSESVEAYRRAVDTIQPIRQEFLVASRKDPLLFRQEVAPVFYELADVLLQRADRAESEEERRALLLEARDTLESLKAAELEDYFQDECVAEAKREILDVVDDKTAVIYPVMLPDRLELLVTLPTGLQRFAVPVTADVLDEKVTELRFELQDRNSQAYLADAQQVYDWLIRPIELELVSTNVTTLVFVPDGALRTIPMAALHDGQSFLIEKYAIAVSPGLSMTDPRPIRREQINLLSAGLTESVQGFPPLPHVQKELERVKELYGGQSLINEEFKVPKVEQELKEEKFSVVHIASHGLVESDPTKTFILSYDDKITMDKLSDLVGTYRLGQEPLELLTLSACETAAGDDRAALGLAGVAVKAGARSALATLWFIDDKASSDLVSEFYQELQDPENTKATALQKAQVKILRDPEKQHPMLWAPFLIISNWL